MDAGAGGDKRATATLYLAQQEWDTRKRPGILRRIVAWFMRLLRSAVAALQRGRDLLLENLALGHQLLVLQRTAKRPRLSGPDRALWVWLARRWRAWKIWTAFLRNHLAQMVSVAFFTVPAVNLRLL